VTGTIVGRDGRRYSGRLVEFRGNGVIVIIYKGVRVAGRNADLPRTAVTAGKA